MHRSPLVGFLATRSAARGRQYRARFEPLEQRNLLSINNLVVATYDNTNGASVLDYQVELAPLASSVATGDHGLGTAQGLAVAPDGSYYVSSTVNYPGAVLHYSASGSYLGTLGENDGNPSPLAVPGALAFGPNGNLYVADFGAGMVYQYDTTSATQQYLAADTLDLGFTPGGVTFTASGDLVVGDLDAQAVYQYHAGSLSATLVAPGSGYNPAALLAEPDGDILIADLDFGFQPTQHHQIVRYDASTTNVSPFIDLTHPLGTGASAGLPPQPTSLGFDRDGNLLIGMSPDHNLNGAIEKFNIDNGALMETLVTGIGTPTGFGISGDQLLVATYDDTDGKTVLAYQTAPSLAASVSTGDHGLGTAQGLAVASDGSYYVSSTANYPGAVLHYNSTGSYLGTLGENDGNSSPLAVPGALVFGPNGNLYVADFGAGMVYQYDTTSATQQYLAADTLNVGYTPGGLAFTSGGDLVVGDLDAQAVFQYHAGSLSATLVAPGSGYNPAALLTEPDNGDLLIADLDFGYEPTQHHQIVRYDYGTTNVSPFIDLTHPLGTGASAGLPPQPTSMLLDRDGNLLVGLSPDHNLDGAVEKFNIDNGALMETLVTGIGTPTGLGVSGNNLVVSTYDDTAGKTVLEYPIVRSASSTVATGDHGLGTAQGLAVASDGSYYVSSTANYPGAVLHYNSTGSYLGTLGENDGNSSPLAVPGALVFGPNGNLYVADFGAGMVYQYDTTSATQQYLAADTLNVGYTPGGLAFTSGGDLVVGDLDAQAVFQYHAGSLSATLVAPGSGYNPAALLTEPDNGDLLIADLDFGYEPTQHHQIVRYDYGTTNVSPFIDLTHPLGTGASAGLPPQPTSMLLDRDGNLLVGLSPDHNLDGAVEKFNIDNGALMETLVTGIGTPTGLGLVPASAPVLDLNGAAAGTSFTSSWAGFAGIPVAITDAANATVSDAGATNLTMLTAALTAPHTGDTLSASNTGHLGIAWSFSGNTLTLSGSDTVANYQAVLRTIKYTNSSGGPLVDSLTVDLQAFDGAIGSNVAVATVTFPPVLDLNGGVDAARGNTTNWYNSGRCPSTRRHGAATAVAPSGFANLSGDDRGATRRSTRATCWPCRRSAGSAACRQATRPARCRSPAARRWPTTRRVAVAQLQQHRGRPGRQLADGHGHGHRRHADQHSGGVHDQRQRSPRGQVLGNRLFYNGSKYDGNNTAINGTSDALAIAPDKIGYVGSASSATFANVSTLQQGHHRRDGRLAKRHRRARQHHDGRHRRSSRLAGLRGGHLQQRRHLDESGPAPSGFSVILGGGTGGSDRIEITWSVNAIKNQWLEVERGGRRQHGLELAGYLLLRQRRRATRARATAPRRSRSTATDVTAQRNNRRGRNYADLQLGRLSTRTALSTAADATRGHAATPASSCTSSRTRPVRSPRSGDAGISSGLAAIPAAPPPCLPRRMRRCPDLWPRPAACNRMTWPDTSRRWPWPRRPRRKDR